MHRLYKYIYSLIRFKLGIINSFYYTRRGLQYQRVRFTLVNTRKWMENLEHDRPRKKPDCVDYSHNWNGVNTVNIYEVDTDD